MRLTPSPLQGSFPQPLMNNSSLHFRGDSNNPPPGGEKPADKAKPQNTPQPGGRWSRWLKAGKDLTTQVGGKLGEVGEQIKKKWDALAEEPAKPAPAPVPAPVAKEPPALAPVVEVAPQPPVQKTPDIPPPVVSLPEVKEDEKPEPPAIELAPEPQPLPLPEAKTTEPVVTTPVLPVEVSAPSEPAGSSELPPPPQPETVTPQPVPAPEQKTTIEAPNPSISEAPKKADPAPEQKLEEKKPESRWTKLARQGRNLGTLLKDKLGALTGRKPAKPPEKPEIKLPEPPKPEEKAPDVKKADSPQSQPELAAGAKETVEPAPVSVTPEVQPSPPVAKEMTSEEVFAPEPEAPQPPAEAPQPPAEAPKRSGWKGWVTRNVPILSKPVQLVDNLQKRLAIRSAFKSSGLGSELQKHSEFIKSNVAILLENHPSQDPVFFQRVSDDSKTLMDALATQSDPAVGQNFVVSQLPQLIQNSRSLYEWETAFRTIKGLMDVSGLEPEYTQFTPTLPMMDAIDTTLELQAKKPQLWSTLGHFANAAPRDERFPGFLKQYGLLVNQLIGETAPVAKQVSEKRCQQLSQVLANQPGASIIPLVTDPDARFLLLMDLAAELPDGEWVKQHQAAQKNGVGQTPRQIIAAAIKGMADKQAADAVQD